MKTTPITDIIIPPTRQRQEFDPEALQELANSITDIGLLHAPVLRQTPEGFILVAGERRLKAIQELNTFNQNFIHDLELVPPGHTPYITLGELGELEAEEAELDENLKRRDLTWQELAAAHERLHLLRGNQMKRAIADPDSIHSQEGDVWTIADTAEELTGRRDGAYQEKTRRELIVAKHLSNPAVQKAKTVDEAFKVLKHQETQQKNIELAESVGKTFSSDLHQLHNIDCLTWMRAYEDGFADGSKSEIDVILTDPPYGMNAQAFGDGAGKLSQIEHHYDDSVEAWRTLMQEWCQLSFLICKPQAHAYVFCDIDRFHELKAMMQSAGWYVFRTPFIRTKSNSGRVPLPDQGPRRQYEILLYAIKGKKPITHIYPDVITTTADEQLSHGAQKPVALFKDLLKRSVNPGDTILDCFAGTGTIIPAAHSFKCKAIVLEQEKEYFAMCLQRLEELG